MNRKIFLLLSGAFFSIYAYAGINDSFRATIGETELIFKITGDNEVQIGDGINSAVSSHASDSLIIPSIVKKDDISYRVTRIGHKAFSECTWLKNVTIPGSIIEIGWGAFRSSGLTSVTVPNTVKFLDDEVFGYCDSLTTATIGDGVTGIGWSTFIFCYSLKEVTIGKNVKYLDGYSFYQCRKLYSITIPSGVKTIGEKAFNGCRLETIDIPEGVETIGDEAFSGCSFLTKVSIPTSVNSIGNKAFASTRWDYNLPNGLNYVGSVAYKYKGQLPANGEVEIKEGTKGIAGGAFSYLSKLTSVILPDELTSIGSNAFSGCSNLSSIEIPNSVTSIGADAFSGTQFYMGKPNGLVYVGKVAYKYKGNLPEDGVIILEKGTSGIAEKAFQNCSNLTDVNIPSSVKVIGANAFSGCNQLSSVIIPASVESIGNYAFQYSPVESFTLYVEWKTPIRIDSSVFYDGENSYRDKSTLYVPKGTITAYKNAPYWKEFGKIEEHEIDGIEVVKDDHHVFRENAVAYFIDGRPAVGKSKNGLHRGLYIIGGRKILIK